MEPPWDGGTKVCSNDPGHMTKMAAMPIYGKNLKKIFFSGTKGPMTLKLCMHKFHMEPPWNGGTKAYSNGPGHLTKMATMPIHGKNIKKSSSPEPKGR